MSAEREARAEPQVVVHKTPAYRVIRGAVWTFLHSYNRLRVEGREHLPRSGGALIVANHQSFLDIPVIAAACPRHVSFVARDTLAESAALAWIMRQCAAVLIRRGSADRAALREMTRKLELEDCVAMFPEGTRSRDGRLGEFRAGAIVAARRTGVPLVPAGIRGALRAWPRERRLPRPARIGIRFGPAIDPGHPRALERVRAAIAAMIGDGSFGSPPAAR